MSDPSLPHAAPSGVRRSTRVRADSVPGDSGAPAAAARARWVILSVALHGGVFGAFAAWTRPDATSIRTPVVVSFAPDTPPELAPPIEEIPPPPDPVRPQVEMDPFPDAPLMADFEATPFPAPVAVESPATRYPAGRLPAGDRAGEPGTTVHGPTESSPADASPPPLAAPPPTPPTAAPAPPAPGPRGETRGPRFTAPPDAPRYPDVARRRGWEGVVRVRVAVAADGTVASVSVVESSGHDVLDAAALDVARAWRIAPAVRDGVPADGTIDVPVRFRLDG